VGEVRRERKVEDAPSLPLPDCLRRTPLFVQHYNRRRTILRLFVTLPEKKREINTTPTVRDRPRMLPSRAPDHRCARASGQLKMNSAVRRRASYGVWKVWNRCRYTPEAAEMTLKKMQWPGDAPAKIAIM
jgi:hypothetical protein